MNTEASEGVLIRQPIHWGVYIPPVVLALMLTLPVLAGLFLFSVFSQMLSALGAPDLPGILLLPLMMPVVLGVGLVFLVWLEVQDAEQVLTTRRLTFRTGWLCRAVGDLPLEKVEATFLVETLLGQMLGYGTVVVIGGGGTRFILAYLPKPHVFHRKLQEALEAIRTGRPVTPVEERAEVPAGRTLAGSATSTGGRFTGILEVPVPKPEPRREPPAASDRTPLEQAWAELTRSRAEGPKDDSRFMPKE